VAGHGPIAIWSCRRRRLFGGFALAGSAALVVQRVLFVNVLAAMKSESFTFLASSQRPISPPVLLRWPTMVSNRCGCFGGHRRHLRGVEGLEGGVILLKEGVRSLPVLRKVSRAEFHLSRAPAGLTSGVLCGWIAVRSVANASGSSWVGAGRSGRATECRSEMLKDELRAQG
jgi:hypothetical protein